MHAPLLLDLTKVSNTVSKSVVEQLRELLHGIKEITGWTIRNASEITRDRTVAKARYAVCIAARSQIPKL